MIATAKAVALETELARRRIKLKRVGRELVGPCPVCGGRDRFAVNVPKQIWNCRGCAKGGDVIALVQHLDNCDFGAALDTLAGGRHFPIRISTPSPPRRTISSSSIPPSASTANIENSDNDYEQRQREKAEWLWAQRQSIEGSIAERYLREARRYAGPPPATLGYLPARNASRLDPVAALSRE